MKKGIILILVLCMVLLTGCSDIKPKEALDETPSASVESGTTVTKENESINNYKYYDVNLINIIDWTTETGAITVPTKIRTNGDRKSTRLNSSHTDSSRMPSSA